MISRQLAATRTLESHAEELLRLGSPEKLHLACLPCRSVNGQRSAHWITIPTSFLKHAPLRGKTEYWAVEAVLILSPADQIADQIGVPECEQTPQGLRTHKT